MKIYFIHAQTTKNLLFCYSFEPKSMHIRIYKLRIKDGRSSLLCNNNFRLRSFFFILYFLLCLMLLMMLLEFMDVRQCFFVWKISKNVEVGKSSNWEGVKRWRKCVFDVSWFLGWFLGLFMFLHIFTHQCYLNKVLLPFFNNG